MYSISNAGVWPKYICGLQAGAEPNGRFVLTMYDLERAEYAPPRNQPVQIILKVYFP